MQVHLPHRLEVRESEGLTGAICPFPTGGGDLLFWSKANSAPSCGAGICWCNSAPFHSNYEVTCRRAVFSLSDQADIDKRDLSHSHYLGNWMLMKPFVTCYPSLHGYERGLKNKRGGDFEIWIFPETFSQYCPVNCLLFFPCLYVGKKCFCWGLSPTKREVVPPCKFKHTHKHIPATTSKIWYHFMWLFKPAQKESTYYVLAQGDNK